MSRSTLDKINHLFRSAIPLVVASFLGNIMGMVVRIILAQSFPSAAFGRIMTGYTVFLFLGTVSMWGLNTALAYYIPRRKERQRQQELIASAVTFGLAVSLLITVGGYQFKQTIAIKIFDDPKLANYLGIFFFAVPAYALFHTLIGAFRGYEEFHEKIILKDIGFNGLEVVAVGAFLLIGLGPTRIGGAYIISTTISFVFATYILTRHHPWRQLLAAFHFIRNRLDDCKLLVMYSTPVVFTAIGLWGADYFDTFLLQSIKGSTSVAYYKAVYPMAISLKMFTGMFTFIYLPATSDLHESKNIDGVRSLYALSTSTSFVLATPAALTLIVFSTSLINIFYPQKYVIAAFALQVLAATFFFESVLGVNRASLNAVGRTQSNLYITLFAFIVNISLNLLWIPPFGIVGAALATMVSFVVWNLITSSWLYYTEGLHPFEPFYLKTALPTFLSNGVTVAILSLILDWISISDNALTFSMIIIPIIIMGYGNLRILLYVIPDEMKNEVDVFRFIEEPIGVLRDYSS